jgi:hypothetical protein
MPMDRSRYPDDWEAIAAEVKTDADWHCDQCGKPCQRPGETFEQLCQRLKGTSWERLLYEQLPEGGKLPHPRRFLLTCAHLNHDPMDCDKSNLRAWCTPCHARYDITPQAMTTKQLLKQGYYQASLPGVGP